MTKRDLFEPDVKHPAIVTFLIYFGFGAVATLTPDFSDYLGIKNKGIYFMVFTIFSILVRFVAGKLSDRQGRIPVTIIGCSFLVFSLFLTGYATTVFLFLAGGAFFGIAMGILSPVLSAWTVDLSSDHNRGRSIASMYIALEAGIGIGAFLSAAIFSNQRANMPWAFYAMGAFALAGLLYTVALHFRMKGEKV